jgi:hypothetical protein
LPPADHVRTTAWQPLAGNSPSFWFVTFVT